MTLDKQIASAEQASEKKGVERTAKKLSPTLYEKITGKKYQIISDSIANGVPHFRLECLETGKLIYLSDTGISARFTEAPNNEARFGEHILGRLSKLL